MKHKILYVEDNLVFRNQVQKRLEAQGWEVIVASDGKEAMDKFQAEQGNFEVAVLDVELPGGYNGWQVAEYITKRNSVVSLIFFSSHHEVADYERGYLAAQALVGNIEGEMDASVFRISAKIVERQSARCSD